MPQHTEADRVRVVGRPGLADRPALPPGHSVTWAAITAGTVIEGERYPYPVWGQDGAPSPPPLLPGVDYLARGRAP